MYHLDISGEWNDIAFSCHKTWDAYKEVCIVLHQWHQIIIWTSDNYLLIWILGTNFTEIFEWKYDYTHSTKIQLKMLSAKWQPTVQASMSRINVE